MTADPTEAQMAEARAMLGQYPRAETVERIARALAARDAEIAELRARLFLHRNREVGYVSGAERAADTIARLTARAEAAERTLAEYRTTHRWNVERVGADLLVCDGEHERSQACEPRRFVPVERAEAAEQRAAAPERECDARQALIRQREEECAAMEQRAAESDARLVAVVADLRERARAIPTHGGIVVAVDARVPLLEAANAIASGPAAEALARHDAAVTAKVLEETARACESVPHYAGQWAATHVRSLLTPGDAPKES